MREQDAFMKPNLESGGFRGFFARAQASPDRLRVCISMVVNLQGEVFGLPDHSFSQRGEGVKILTQGTSDFPRC